MEVVESKIIEFVKQMICFISGYIKIQDIKKLTK